MPVQRGEFGSVEEEERKEWKAEATKAIRASK